MRTRSQAKHSNHGGESFFVLIGGESRDTQGCEERSKREFLHTSVPFIGQAYQCLRDAGVPRRRIITICQLNDYRTTLYMGAKGQFVSDKGVLPKFYKKQLNETDEHCRLLLEEGGADYDYDAVNPETVLNVLCGNVSRDFPKVVPKVGCSALFFAVYSHGNSHGVTNQENNGNPHSHNHQNAEWFSTFPYPAKSPDILDFVASENAGDRAPFYLYSTQLRLAFHRLFSSQPHRPVVGLLNYCTSGGNLEFLRRPSVVRTFGMDQWPLFLMSSTGKTSNSLVAGLWLSIFHRLGALLQDPNDGHTLQSFFDSAVCGYHKDNIYELLNECKERAYSDRVWRLDFGYQDPNRHSNEPWHTDLRDTLLATKDGKPNTKALAALQHAYTNGIAFRSIRRDQANNNVLQTHQFASHPKNPDRIVVWARDPNSRINPADGSSSWWSHIPFSRPYKCPIISCQGTICEVNLAAVVLDAFGSIARPEFACGINSGITLAVVFQTLS